MFSDPKSISLGIAGIVYEEFLSYELQKSGFKIKRQHGIPVKWEEVKMNLGFRADLIMEDKILIELKSVEALAPVYF